MSDDDTDRRFERIEVQLARLEAKLDEVLRLLRTQTLTESTRPTTDTPLPPGGRLFDPSELDLDEPKGE